MPSKVALLLDGGFVKKKLRQRQEQFATATDITSLCTEILAKPRLEKSELFRIFYYDAPPYEGDGENPISREVTRFSTTLQAKQNRALLDSLELQEDFAVRRGELMLSGWKLGSQALRSLRKGGPREIHGKDLVPDLSQKGVDLRIGLDIASLSVKRIVDILVLVTGDSDLVPAIKFARKEGLRVYLECLGHGVRRDLKAHADVVL